MSKQKFFKCEHCGNIVGLIENQGVPLFCCGEKMKELVPNTTDASGEKHVPVVTQKGDIITVNIGSIDHPMTKEHHIVWVYVETENGGQRKNIMDKEKPVAEFALIDDKMIRVFAYCNIHGLWAN